MAKEHKASDVRSRYLSGNRFYRFARECLSKKDMGQCRFAEKAGCLLPLAFARNVRVVPSPESKDRQDVSFCVVVMTQPAPRLIISAGQLFERSRTELRMARQKANDLQGVLITNDAQAAAPRITVTVGQD